MRSIQRSTRERRLAVEIPVWLKGMFESEHTAVAVNISRNGMFIATPATFPSNLLQVAVALPEDDEVTLFANVKHSAGSYQALNFHHAPGFGVKLLPYSDDIEKWRVFVEGLAA